MLFTVVCSCGFPQGSKIKASLQHQCVRVGLETLRVDLRIEPVRVSAFAVAVHEVAFDLEVPKSRKVDSRSDDFVVDVISVQADVGLGGNQRSKRASGASGY